MIILHLPYRAIRTTNQNHVTLLVPLIVGFKPFRQKMPTSTDDLYLASMILKTIMMARLHGSSSSRFALGVFIVHESIPLGLQTLARALRFFPYVPRLVQTKPF